MVFRLLSASPDTANVKIFSRQAEAQLLDAQRDYRLAKFISDSKHWSAISLTIEFEIVNNNLLPNNILQLWYIGYSSCKTSQFTRRSNLTHCAKYKARFLIRETAYLPLYLCCIYSTLFKLGGKVLGKRHAHLMNNCEHWVCDLFSFSSLQILLHCRLLLMFCPSWLSLLFYDDWLLAEPSLSSQRLSHRARGATSQGTTVWWRLCCMAVIHL